MKIMSAMNVKPYNYYRISTAFSTPIKRERKGGGLQMLCLDAIVHR